MKIIEEQQNKHLIVDFICQSLVALSTTLVEYSGAIVIVRDRPATHLPSWKPRYVLIDSRCFAVPSWQSLSIPISIPGDLLPGWPHDRPNDYQMASRKNESEKQRENGMTHGREPKATCNTKWTENKYCYWWMDITIVTTGEI